MIGAALALLRYSDLTDDPADRAHAEALLDDVVANADLDRNEDDTFGADWAGPPQPATVATQSAAVVALDRAALAARPYAP